MKTAFYLRFVALIERFWIRFILTEATSFQIYRNGKETKKLC